MDWSLEVIALLSLVLKGLVLGNQWRNLWKILGILRDVTMRRCGKISNLMDERGNVEIGCFLVVDNRNIHFFYMGNVESEKISSIGP